MTAAASYLLVGPDGAAYRSPTPGTVGGHRGTRVYGRLDCPAALRALGRGGYVASRVFFAAETVAAAAGSPRARCLPGEYAHWRASRLVESGFVTRPRTGPDIGILRLPALAYQSFVEQCATSWSPEAWWPRSVRRLRVPGAGRGADDGERARGAARDQQARRRPDRRGHGAPRLGRAQPRPRRRSRAAPAAPPPTATEPWPSRAASTGPSSAAWPASLGADAVAGFVTTPEAPAGQDSLRDPRSACLLVAARSVLARHGFGAVTTRSADAAASAHAPGPRPARSPSPSVSQGCPARPAGCPTPGRRPARRLSRGPLTCGYSGRDDRI